MRRRRCSREVEALPNSTTSFTASPYIGSSSSSPSWTGPPSFVPIAGSCSSLGASRNFCWYSAVPCDFHLSDEGRVQSMHPRRARRQIQHVALAEQSLGAVRVENGARVDLRCHAERNASREVGLDQSGDHIHR